MSERTTPREERRSSQRIPLLVRVECTTRRKYILGRCENLSETGMLLSAMETFDEAEPVTLRFLIPPIASGKAIEAAATVVRSQPGEHMAVKFVRLSDKAREAIALLVERNKVQARGGSQ